MHPKRTNKKKKLSLTEAFCLSNTAVDAEQITLYSYKSNSGRCVVSEGAAKGFQVRKEWAKAMLNCYISSRDVPLMAYHPLLPLRFPVFLLFIYK